MAVVGATALPNHSSNMKMCPKALFIAYICVQGCAVIKGGGTVCFLGLTTFWSIDPYLPRSFFFCEAVVCSLSLNLELAFYEARGRFRSAKLV